MKDLYYLITIYFIILNMIGFAIMGIDKKRAKNKKWRIKEKTLFLIAVIGGSIGSIIGMQYFHHKTKHNKFIYGMPLILIIQIIVFLLILNKMK